jgi:hypothetical protein
VLFDALLFSEQFPFFFDDGAYESLDSLFSERGAGALEEQLCADAREERRRDLTRCDAEEATCDGRHESAVPTTSSGLQDQSVHHWSIDRLILLLLLSKLRAASSSLM